MAATMKRPTNEELMLVVNHWKMWGSHGFREASKAFGIPYTSYYGKVMQATRRGLIANPETGITPPEGMEVAAHSYTLDSSGGIKLQHVRTRQAPGEPYELPLGHIVKGESALVNPDGEVITKWIKTRVDPTHTLLLDGLKEAFEGYRGGSPSSTVTSGDSNQDLLTLYPLPDLHLGMYAWKNEAGDDYDVDIAYDLACSALDSLVSRAEFSSNAVILGLGDYFHANDTRGVTPAHQHRLDVDGRWAKVFAAGAKLACRIIDRVAAKHPNVQVVFLPGNHDPDAAIALTVALSLFYSNNVRIRVDEAAAIAWYRRFGKVLLGATHGHTMKPDRMAMMLAVDRAEDWGESLFRHMFFGHVHHESMLEVAGVRVESFTSPAAKDAFNANHGYRSTRSLQAITFHKNRGEIARHKVMLNATR